MKNDPQFQLQLHKPFTINDLPKEPKNAAEKVLVFCVKLFQTTNKPVVILNDPYDQTTPRNKARMACSNLSRLDLTPRGDGAIEAFERDFNAMENELGNDYIEQW